VRFSPLLQNAGVEGSIGLAVSLVGCWLAARPIPLVARYALIRVRKNWVLAFAGAAYPCAAWHQAGSSGMSNDVWVTLSAESHFPLSVSGQSGDSGDRLAHRLIAA